jgi:hypothetical protein
MGAWLGQPVLIPTGATPPTPHPVLMLHPSTVQPVVVIILPKENRIKTYSKHGKICFHEKLCVALTVFRSRSFTGGAGDLKRCGSGKALMFNFFKAIF